MPDRVASATRIAALLLALTTTLACGSFRLPFSLPFLGSQSMSGSTMTEDELRNELSGYAARFGAYVSDASEDIASESQDRAIRRRTLIWQMKMIPPVQDAAFADTAQEGFLRVLGLALDQDRGAGHVRAVRVVLDGLERQLLRVGGLASGSLGGAGGNDRTHHQRGCYRGGRPVGNHPSLHFEPPRRS